MDIAKIKEQARAGWSMGEYTGLSEMLRPAAQRLADACAVSAGQEVLDVAAGDGNFAVACADEGATVVASDIAPGMVEKGRARTAAEGYGIEWLEADAEDLPFEDGRFDCVGSVFGAMIAPRPRVAAEEMFRVVRPGNTVGMTAWCSEGPTYDMFQLTRNYGPPAPDGLPRLEEWSQEQVVRERFDGLANSIELERATLPWSADSPEEFVAGMERHAPMQAAAKANMAPDRYAEMYEKLVEMARGWAGGDGPFEVDAHYMLIVARRRG
ncbi:MAG: class I SAM-dependent methyltransferase [Actinomycetota bacterium]|nr:class I SAM-dependent methyltransferase [Actinomycetota bacterium]